MLITVNKIGSNSKTIKLYYQYIYKTEVFEAPTNFHVSTIF